MKVSFQEGGEDWWFDPDSGEYHYEGENTVIDYLLRNMGMFQDVRPELQDDLSHPGETWEAVSSEERKEKVINYLSRVDGVDIHERKEAQRS